MRGRLGVVVLCALSTSTVAVAVPGERDSSWGRSGVVRTLMSSGAPRLEVGAFSALRARSGKIVVAGRSTVARPVAYSERIGPVIVRYTSRGRLDGSFGRGGILRGRTSIGVTREDWVLELALPDGRLLVRRVADDPRRRGLMRLLPNGRIDRTFGVRGRARPVTGGCQREARGLLRQRDGNIVALTERCGRRHGDNFFSLIRLHPNGRVDRAFGRDGVASVRVGVPDRPGDSITVASQPDGKLVVGGVAHVGRERYALAVVRFTRNGQVDRSFGRSGTALSAPIDFGAGFGALFVRPGGKILAAGCKITGTEEPDTLYLLQYLRNGSPDPHWGTAGVLDLGDPGVSDVNCADFAEAPGGKIMFLGTKGIHRLNSDGSPDSGVGRNGVLQNRIGETMVVQPDGKIVLVGRAKAPGKRWLVVERYLG